MYVGKHTLAEGHSLDTYSDLNTLVGRPVQRMVYLNLQVTEHSYIVFEVLLGSAHPADLRVSVDD